MSNPVFCYITKTSIFKYIETFITKMQMQKKILLFFIFLLKNIDYGYSFDPPRRGGSNEYPQSMFLRRNKKNNVYPCKPEFYYIKIRFMGVNIIYACFRDDISICSPLKVLTSMQSSYYSVFHNFGRYFPLRKHANSNI